MKGPGRLLSSGFFTRHGPENGRGNRSHPEGGDETRPYSAASKLRRQRYRQILRAPYFTGKLKLLDILRGPLTSLEQLVPEARFAWGLPTPAKKAGAFRDTTTH